MKGFKLIEKLADDFRKTGTASEHVLVRDKHTGAIYDIVDTRRTELPRGGVLHEILVTRGDAD